MKVRKIRINYNGTTDVHKQSFVRFMDQTKSWYDAYAKKSYTTARTIRVTFAHRKQLHWLVYP